MRGVIGLVIVGSIAASIAGTGVAAAAEKAHECPMPPPHASAELEQIKQLAGRWEGTAHHGSAPAEPIVVEYKVTSGGSAVVETLSPGTPHEMVSVYHDRKGALSMTHYCMLGNQPELALTQKTGQQMAFSLAPGSDIDAAHELHMHALTLAWAGPDQITQTWGSFKDGQPQPDATVIELHRVR